MGVPSSVWETRSKLLKAYQGNREIFQRTGNPGAKFMHYLPVFHNRETKIGEISSRKIGLQAMEVADEVFESEASIVFDQAENRMHTIKTVMFAALEG